MNCLRVENDKRNSTGSISLQLEVFLKVLVPTGSLPIDVIILVFMNEEIMLDKSSASYSLSSIASVIDDGPGSANNSRGSPQCLL